MLHDPAAFLSIAVGIVCGAGSLGGMLRNAIPREAEARVMQIDAATRRNLELTRSLSGGRDGSLLSAIDRTVTAGGGRLLERRLSSPSRDLDVIHDRLGKIDALVESSGLRGELRTRLRLVPDIDRALSRLLKDDWPRTLEELEEKLPGR